MITDRDKELIEHFMKYKYATISQLEQIFFKDAQYSYNICRRRLKELRFNNYIKVEKNTEINKNIYMLNRDNVKLPSTETIMALDVYAKLKELDFNIVDFKVNKSWGETGIKTKGFFIFTVEKRRYSFFLEINNLKNEIDFEKYLRLKESGEVQKYLNRDFFPKLMILTDYNIENKINEINTVEIKTNLSNLAHILI